MSVNGHDLSAALVRSRLIVIVRLLDHAPVVEVIETLAAAGVRFVEVTLERPGGLAALERAVAQCGDRLIIGAGTVMSESDAERAANAGARFIVSPHTDPLVITAGIERGLVVVPGAMTPSEVVLARSAGAQFVKLFPAGSLGTAHLTSLRGPFPEVRFVPTGGVSNENASSWFDAGAAAVAMGSSLVPSSGDLDGLFERARLAVACTSADTSSE
ncbi:MAG: bifunctional 4-hydroxy-2-oxoglutarate aldolase/2-dehydro-3-deoxy-phosphogluconate aldolase [Acidimicrobiales bacterium]